MKINIPVAAAIILIIVVVFFTTLPGEYDDFAKCISSSGAKFYGSSTCPHCEEQKEMFGKSAQYLPYVECSLPNYGGVTQECQDANISSVPAWKFIDGKEATGRISFEELSAYTGCPLPA